jgi:hypothetical protein
MEHIGIMQGVVAHHGVPLHKRFFSKVVIDVLPAALTSVIGGFLITQYQFNHAAALRPAIEQAAPASAEMVQLVRDEHSAIMDYLNAQIAAEKSRNAAADAADAHAAANAKAAAETPAAASAHATPAVVVTAKAVASRSKTPVVMAALPPGEPLVIAQAAPNAGAKAVEQPSPPSKSLLDRTLDIKDHVVGATLHAVSAIGSIPSWIASMGDRGGSAETTSSPGTRSFAS